ncbi:ABC transporter permease [Arthrobacter sp. Sa2BUA2]|uniref:ABC transporter permease n=1 Tax=Arthrobacter pullicola TaxID=2762224 RepID=A0ABR8YJ86_9MICC|nr:ABC transporter permease [Arthrobacter pullicola]MBD8044269.1 ABC transporter permease [Arthrobacter pullicola]
MSLSGITATLVEAWTELRIHKARILLALVGVALSVAALTAVVGLADMARAAMAQGSESQGGRPATLNVSAYSMDGSETDAAGLRDAYVNVAERYSVEHSSLFLPTQIPFQFPDGVAQTDALVVDADFGTMRRVNLQTGTWFTEADTQRMAPAVIVNEAFYARMGSPDLALDPVVEIWNGAPVDAVITGVRANTWEQEMPAVYLLTAAYDRLGLTGGGMGASPMLELWVPEEIALPLQEAITADLTAQFPNFHANVYRSDYAAWGDPYAVMELVVGGIAAMVMVLGAVGLLNISMVTVKYRVREIGIRRSFGATSGRIFFGVMLESVVATFAAGVVGVMAAIALVKLPIVQQQIASGVAELPPFPIEAALLGLGAATAVGTLAGLIPALVAVRVKVIDAIRY